MTNCEWCGKDITNKEYERIFYDSEDGEQGFTKVCIPCLDNAYHKSLMKHWRPKTK